MSVETWINLVAVVGSAITLYFLLRRPIERLETDMKERFEKVDARFEKMDARFDKMDARFDDFVRDLTALRMETRESVARHDERLVAIEKQRPHLIVQ